MSEPAPDAPPAPPGAPDDAPARQGGTGLVPLLVGAGALGAFALDQTALTGAPLLLIVAPWLLYHGGRWVIADALWLSRHAETPLGRLRLRFGYWGQWTVAHAFWGLVFGWMVAPFPWLLAGIISVAAALTWLFERPLLRRWAEHSASHRSLRIALPISATLTALGPGFIAGLIGLTVAERIGPNTPFGSGFLDGPDDQLPAFGVLTPLQTLVAVWCAALLLMLVPLVVFLLVEWWRWFSRPRFPSLRT